MKSESAQSADFDLTPGSVPQSDLHSVVELQSRTHSQALGPLSRSGSELNPQLVEAMLKRNSGPVSEFGLCQLVASVACTFDPL